MDINLHTSYEALELLVNRLVTGFLVPPHE